MQETEPELHGFDDPKAVVAFLADLDGDLDRKDRLLATLVRRLQAGENTELVSALLWLGLWPGLDAVFRTVQRCFHCDADEAVSTIAATFIDRVATMDLERVHRVACGLVRSTRRDVVRELQRERETTEHVTDATRADVFDLPEEGHRRGDATFRTCIEPPLRGWLLPIDDGDAERAVAKLHAALATIVGADAELLVAVLVLEENQHEVAERLGLSHTAARKRTQRALRRVRVELKESVSHFAEPGGVSSVWSQQRHGGKQR